MFPTPLSQVKLTQVILVQLQQALQQLQQQRKQLQKPVVHLLNNSLLLLLLLLLVVAGLRDQVEDRKAAVAMAEDTK